MILDGATSVPMRTMDCDFIRLGLTPRLLPNGSVAQLDRALGYEPRDWGIVLLHSYHFLWVCSSIGLEHSALTRRVASSSLAAPTIFNAPVAQLAEQQTLNLWVGGSIPPRSTIVNGL